LIVEWVNRSRRRYAVQARRLLAPRPRWPTRTWSTRGASS